MNKGRQEEIKMRFGAGLREIRKAQELSEEKVAPRCGLDSSHLRQIELGESNVSLINIERIAQALGLGARELLDWGHLP